MFVITPAQISDNGPVRPPAPFHQTFQLPAHLLPQLLFKEFFPVGKIQLKMAVAEDFQFSHQGVAPPCEFALQEDTLLPFPTKSTHKYLRYLCVDGLILRRRTTGRVYRPRVNWDC